MLLGEARKPKFRQRFGRHGLVHVARTGVPPRSTTVESGSGGASRVDTTAAEFAEARAWSLPLPPQNAAQFTAKPPVEFLEHAFDV